MYSYCKRKIARKLQNASFMATWHDNKPLLHPNRSIELHMFSMKNSLSSVCITNAKEKLSDNYLDIVSIDEIKQDLNHYYWY